MNAVPLSIRGRFAFFAGLFMILLALALITEEYLLLILPFAVLLFYAAWERRELLFYILLFSLPFSFEFSFSSSLGTDIPDEFLMILTSIIFVCFAFLQPQPLMRKYLQHPLTGILAAGLCWTALSVYFSTEPYLSFKFLLARTWYLGAFVLAPLILFRDQDKLRKAALVLVISISAVTVITLVRHAFHGFSFATINDSLDPFFRNHVNYSAMLVILLPVFIACWWFAKGKNKKLAGVLTGLLLAALLFSYARGAWLALIAGMIAFYALRKKWLFTLYLSFLLFITGSVVWLKSDDRYLRYAHDYRHTIFHENFREHLIATYKMQDVSTAERFYRWIAGVRMLGDGRLTGFGPTSFYSNYKSYTTPIFRTWVSANPEHSTVHNYFLLLAIEQGIPGLILFVVLTAAMFWYAERIWHRNKDLFSKATAAVCAMMLTAILTVNFLSDMIETDKVGSLFLLCLAALIAADVHSRAGSDPAPDVERIP